MSMAIEELFSVRGRTVLITGGSRGIGEMFARGFVENGAKVYISSRKAAVCEELAAELSQYGTCIALPADLGSMAEVERLAAELAAREPKLDVLINNAGNTWGAPVESFPEVGWDKVMTLNVKSIFFLTQKLLPQLAAAGSDDHWARVINIASIEGMHVSPLEAISYVTSKASVIHMSRVLAAKLAKHRIAVNSISPGYFPSQMTDGIKDTMGEATRLATPMLRWGKPEDMAGVALYLSSKASGFVTGANIPVDGGLATTS